MSRIAGLVAAYPDYTDAAEARSEKLHGAWADVPTEALDADLAEHLVELDNGRVGWRMSVPAVVASWGEMARPFVLPPRASRRFWCRHCACSRRTSRPSSAPRSPSISGTT